MPRAKVTQSGTRNTPASRLVPLLLAWFDANARDLPWRRTRDPYAIWVSEIMLQQTQVKTVLPYWEGWMRALPNIDALANAGSHQIHKLWEGLGYYTRVRNMQKAARQIIAEYGGQFPRDFDDILALPGIGRYTAGAICSIAFNQPAPILDGNVIRLLTRVFGIQENPREKQTNAQLWQLATDLVLHASRLKPHVSRITFHATRNTQRAPTCSHLNQSLMELGALICTPRQPACEACPIALHCVARQRDEVHHIPNLPRRKAAKARRFAAFVVRRKDEFLVRQRPAGVVNAQLWEFPNVEVNGHGSALKRLAKDVLGFAPESLKPWFAIKHSITRYRITLDVFKVNADAGANRSLCGEWFVLPELSRLSFPSAHRKIVTRLEDR